MGVGGGGGAENRKKAKIKNTWERESTISGPSPGKGQVSVSVLFCTRLLLFVSSHYLRA